MKKCEIVEYLTLIEYKRINIVDTLEEARQIIKSNKEYIIYELEYYSNDIMKEYLINFDDFNLKYDLIEKENYNTYLDKKLNEILKISYVE